MARAGNLHKAQAIMKGFKRGMQKNITNNEQAVAYKGLNSAIGEVYSKMGD